MDGHMNAVEALGRNSLLSTVHVPRSPAGDFLALESDASVREPELGKVKSSHRRFKIRLFEHDGAVGAVRVGDIYSVGETSHYLAVHLAEGIDREVHYRLREEEVDILRLVTGHTQIALLAVRNVHQVCSHRHHLAGLRDAVHLVEFVKAQSRLGSLEQAVERSHE